MIPSGIAGEVVVDRDPGRRAAASFLQLGPGPGTKHRESPKLQVF